MLAEPIFQFNEELAKPTIAPAATTSGASGSMRASLKRPSKLELKINLNEQQTALSSPQAVPTQSLASNSHHHDKNNNLVNNNNSSSSNNQNNPPSNVSVNNVKTSLVLKDASNNSSTSNNTVHLTKKKNIISREFVKKVEKKTIIFTLFCKFYVFLQENNAFSLVFLKISLNFKFSPNEIIYRIKNALFSTIIKSN